MIKMRSKVKDTITGFTGIVTGKIEYLNGCKRYQIQPQKLTKDGKIAEAEWIDSQQVELVNEPDSESTQEDIGGPGDLPPTDSIPSI